MTTLTDPTTITITRTAPGVICDETTEGTAVLVDPGEYVIESIDHDEQLAYLDVPAEPDFYVAGHTDWLTPEGQATLPTRRKA